MAGQSDNRQTSWTADELMRTWFAEPRWAVPGLVSEGLNLLVGAPKVGKSWLSLNLGIAVASGSTALGALPVQIGDVLYLALEDTGRRLKQRVGMALGDRIPPPLLTLQTEAPPFGLGGEKHIATWLDEHPAARLVIIDVFARMRGTGDGKANRYDEDYREMTRVKAVADDYGVACMAVHHARKLGSGDFLDVVSGTNGLAGACDTILVMERTRGQNHALLRVTGRDVEEAEHPMSFAHGRWTMADAQEMEQELSEARRRILDAVRNLGPMTPVECARAMAAEYENVKKTMRRMFTDEQLKVDDDGRYRLP